MEGEISPLPFFSSLTGVIIKLTQDRLKEEGLTLATPWTVACQAPLSVGFSRQEYWSGLPFPFLGDLPDPGIEPQSPALQAETLPTELQGKSQTKRKKKKKSRFNSYTQKSHTNREQRGAKAGRF